jgi:ribosome-associated toxin RatA of RatAB toxin-antitoxin module
VQECQLLETIEDGMAQIFRQRAKLTWFLPSFEHEFRLDYAPPDRIDVNRVSGPFDVLDGTWWLLPGEEASITLVYTLSFEPGMPIPRFVVGRMLRRDVPIILAEIRDRAEAL